MAKRRHIVFIINPKAGIGLFPNIDKRIEARFNTDDIAAEIIKTSCAGQAKDYCRQLVTNDTPPDAVVAVGGDGTVNEVINGLGTSGIPMGIVPIGSGNGLARHLGLSMLPKNAFKTIEAGFHTPIDLIEIGKSKLAANVAGVGFDAIISWKFQDSKLRGPLSYAAIIMKEFLRFEPKKYQIMADGQSIELEAAMITIANSSQFGNNAFIAPGASVRDGWLDLCILSPFPKAMTAELAAKIITGNIDKSSYYKRFRIKKLRIKQKSDAYQMDGEFEGQTTKVDARILEKKLKVIIPEHNLNKI